MNEATSRASNTSSSGELGYSRPRRVRIRCGRAMIPIDVVSLPNVLTWLLTGKTDRWDVVVTPNLHHLNLARQSPSVAKRYEDARLSLADGWPVAWLASRVSGYRVRRVAGADLMQGLVENYGSGTPLVLVGGIPGTQLDALLRRCADRGWRVSNELAPRAELVDESRRTRLIRKVADAGSGGIIVIGIGAPMQEQVATEIAERPGCGIVLCLGMSINFSSGVAHRAPRSIQALRLEWVYRAAQEPQRLLLRYLKDASILPALVWDNPNRRKIYPGYKTLMKARYTCQARNLRRDPILRSRRQRGAGSASTTGGRV